MSPRTHIMTFYPLADANRIHLNFSTEVYEATFVIIIDFIIKRHDVSIFWEKRN